MKTFEFKPKLFTALRNYSKETFLSDLMAGIIVGIVALPLAIAFGIASGVSPEKGIITAIIAPVQNCNCVWNYSAIWRNGIDCCNHYGRSIIDSSGSI